MRKKLAPYHALHQCSLCGKKRAIVLRHRGERFCANCVRDERLKR